MSLREQIFQRGQTRGQSAAYVVPTPLAASAAPTTSPGVASAAPAALAASAARSAYQQHTKRIHQQVVERVDLDKLNRLPAEQQKNELAQLINAIAEEEKIMLNEHERKNLVQDVQDDMLGLGPLEPMLKDPSISDILVNTAEHIYVERHGKLMPVESAFHDNAHLMRVIERIVSRIGRRIDESSPMVDARLADGSRVNAIIPPSAIDGPLLSIRRFPSKALTINDLVNGLSMTGMMAQLLEAAIKVKLNVLISGGTGCGKTTLLNLLSGFIPADERIVTIEDAAELQLQQEHVLRLETRPPNIEGKGEINQQSLLKNALRMRPDRIVLGEVRGAEALDMLGAMNSGHEGSMATTHANTPRDALTRMENMVTMASPNLTTKGIRYQISSAISLVVQISRLSDGKRRIISIQEITGMEGDVISMQEIFAFRRSGIDAQGKVTGAFCATGVNPNFIEKMTAHGIHLPDNMFDPSRSTPV